MATAIQGKVPCEKGNGGNGSVSVTHGVRRATRVVDRRLTAVGADGHVIEAAAAPPHFMECPQHNQTLGVRN